MVNILNVCRTFICIPDLRVAMGHELGNCTMQMQVVMCTSIDRGLAAVMQSKSLYWGQQFGYGLCLGTGAVELDRQLEDV